MTIGLQIISAYRGFRHGSLKGQGNLQWMDRNGDLQPFLLVPTMGTHVSFIFSGYKAYNPYFEGLKPSFFHGFLGSQGRVAV